MADFARFRAVMGLTQSMPTDQPVTLDQAEQSRLQVDECFDRHGKVRLRLRVGIAGHRSITGDHPGLASEIAKAVEYITQVLVADPNRLRSEDPCQMRPEDIILTAVSSLSEGADRVVAGEILKRKGTQLEAVLPLTQSDYLHDFSSPASVEQFNHLIGRAICTDVAGTAGSRQQAYEQAGRAVVDRSDVMIVVWDGKPARGRGGTAEIYAYAQRWQKPVLLIRVDDRSARLDPVSLRHAARGTCPLTPEGMKWLDLYNGDKHPPDATIGSLSPLLAQSSSRPWLKSATSQIEYFSRYFTRADLLARRFQRLWLRTNRSLYVLAPLAVLVVAAQIVFAPSHTLYAGLEFLILVCITLLLIVTRQQRWHTRWIAARYLAEQVRSLIFLGLTGIVTPEKSASSAYRQAVGVPNWTERAANEIWFARPRYAPPSDISLLVEVLYEEWIKKQQEYHSTVSDFYRRRSNLFHALTISLFSLSALAALLHSLGVKWGATEPFQWWEFLAVAIPAVAAALGGYGAQRDYVRHAERSRLFACVMEDEIARLMAARNLKEIQRAALAVSRALRSEATDWYSVVHSQDIELPS
jgi:hypothetical protein